MTRAATGGFTARGTTNVRPYRVLKRLATSRASSTCWRLVLADRHLVGVVQQDVGRHQHRIGQQRQPHRVRAGRLLPELDHPGGLAVAGGALEQVVQLGVLGYVGLYVTQRRGRVDAAGQQWWPASRP